MTSYFQGGSHNSFHSKMLRLVSEHCLCSSVPFCQFLIYNTFTLVTAEKDGISTATNAVLYLCSTTCDCVIPLPSDCVHFFAFSALALLLGHLACKNVAQPSPPEMMVNVSGLGTAQSTM